jgi:hypothetical protein
MGLMVDLRFPQKAFCRCWDALFKQQSGSCQKIVYLLGKERRFLDLAAAIRTGFARIFPEDWGRRFEPCCAHAFSPRFWRNLQVAFRFCCEWMRAIR